MGECQDCPTEVPRLTVNAIFVGNPGVVVLSASAVDSEAPYVGFSTHLKAHQARSLARALLAAAERLDPQDVAPRRVLDSSQEAKETLQDEFRRAFTDETTSGSPGTPTSISGDPTTSGRV